MRWGTVGRIAVGWVLTLPASAAVGAFAALLVVWFGNWGILIDAILALVIIVSLFVRSRRNAVDSSNAMSEVADSGLAVKVPRKAPPTRRQRAIEREEARLKAEAKAREKAERKKADAEAKARAKAGNTSAKKGPQR